MPGSLRFAAPRSVVRTLWLLLAASAAAGGCDCRHGSSSSDITASTGIPQVTSKVNFGNVQVGQHVQLQVPLKNGGAGALAILNQSISGDSTQSFSEPKLYAKSLAVGGASTATLQFAPTQAGPLSATLELADDGVPSSVPMPLTGVGVDIEVAAAPSSVNFGNVQVGASPAPTQNVVFTNNGTSQALVSVSAVNTAPEFTVTDSQGPVSSGKVQTLAPGGTYQVTVAFEPDQAQNFSSSLAWTACNNPSTCVNPPAISLNGVGITGALQLSPSPVGFSGVPTGQTSSLPVTATNTGTNGLQVTCVYLKSLGASSCGQPSALFGFSNYSPSDPSGRSPVTLSPNQSLTFTVTYTASGGTSDTDELDVSYVPQGTSSTSTATDQLLGNQSLAPCTLAISPSTASFGTVVMGTPVSKTIALSNSGESDCNISAVALDPSSDQSYALAQGQATSFTVPAGGSASIGVTFNLDNNNAPTIRQGDVDFQSNDLTYAQAKLPLVAYLVTNSPYANGWPKWHYDNNNSGKTSADTSNDTGQVLWQYSGLQPASGGSSTGGGNNSIITSSINGGAAYINSPVVGDSANGNGYTIYQVSLDGNLVALDQSGNLLWKTMLSSETGDSHPSTPAVTKDGHVYAVTGCDAASITVTSNGTTTTTGGGNTNNLFYLDLSGNILSQQPYGEDGFDACPGLGPDGTFFEADDDGEVGSGSSGDPYSVMAFTASGSGQVSLETGLALPLSNESERFGVGIGDDSSSYWGNNGQFFAVTAPGSGFRLAPGWPGNGVNVDQNTPAGNGSYGTSTPSSGSGFGGFGGLGGLGGLLGGDTVSDVALDPVNTNLMFAYSAWEDDNGNVVGVLAGLSMATGAMQWSYGMPATLLPSGWSPLASDYGNAAPAVDITNGQVYVGNGDGLRALDESSGTLKWFFASADVSSSPAIGGDGTVFFGCIDGSFYAVSSSGALKYKVTATSSISSSPAIADDGTVFFVSNDGVLWAVR